MEHPMLYRGQTTAQRIGETLRPATTEFAIMFLGYAIAREPVPDRLKAEWAQLERIRSYAEQALFEYL